ncbi:MAG: radical SAM protein [Candidatus Riflebacteria bacterium]|nr:radical SAM protein [Candidatus Riflebacteria bacterium]
MGASENLGGISDGQLTVTSSVCRECRKIVPAKVIVRSGRIYFEKHCAEHGMMTSLIADDAEQYLDSFNFHRKASVPLEFSRNFNGSCPDSCGFCPEHEQHVCMPVVEITDHCDLACPVCIVKNHQNWHMTIDEFRKILDRLIETEGSIDVLNLSGGEPTLHPQFRELVDEILKHREILRASVSTNGLKLSQDPELLKFLAERNVVISLQYDGSDSFSTQRLRGSDTTASKSRLIDQISEIDAPCSLTYTLTPGVNEKFLGNAIDYLFTRQNILSLMIQPVSYCGTGSSFEVNGQQKRIFIPEVMQLVEKHSGKRAFASDFSPLPCSHPACFSLSFFLNVGSGEYRSIKKFFEPETYLSIIKNRALFGTDPENFQIIEDAVYQLWSGPCALTPDSERSLKAVKTLLKKAQKNSANSSCFNPSAVVNAAERDIKSIFIHGFMDADTFDLSRARKCCQVYPLRDGRFMPICVYNVLERS